MRKHTHNQTCCFTGHRPEKLALSEEAAKDVLNETVRLLIKNEFTAFISGMARGTDMWAAETVIEYKKTNKDIKLICALPHPDFEKKWSKENQQRYNYILSKADEIHTISDTFSMGAYMIRNKWMVDRSDLVVSFFNGTPGGTKNTIDYARKTNKKVLDLYDKCK